MDGHRTAVDINTLLRGSSSAPGNSEAEATSRWRGTSLAGKCILQYIWLHPLKDARRRRV